jgi:hypothetical protein
VRKNAYISVGDSVTVTCNDSVSGTVLRVQVTATTDTAHPKPTQFVIDTEASAEGLQRTAAHIANTLNNDPAFQDAGFTASAVVIGSGIAARQYVKITTPPGVRFNTEASVAVSSPSNGLSLKQVIRGGLDPVWSFRDLVGMDIRITDAVPYNDTECYWSVFCTGDIDSGFDPNVFYRIAYIDASVPANTSLNTAPTHRMYTHVITEADVADVLTESDTIDLASEFSVSITVSGTDSSGASAIETLTLDRSTFTDCLDPDMPADKRWVRMHGLVTRVDSWVVNDANGVGDAELVVMAESGADAGSCFSLCKLDWSGSAITAIEDTRMIVSSAQSRKDTSAIAIGEALTHTSVLLDMLK